MITSLSYLSKGALSPQWLETLSFKEISVVKDQLEELMIEENKIQEKKLKEMERNQKKQGRSKPPRRKN